MHTYNIRHKPLPPHWRGTASLEYVLFQIVASRGARIDRMRAHAGQLRHPASVASQKSGYPRAPSCQTYAHSPQATHTHKLHNAPLAHAVRRSIGPASKSLRTYLHHAPPEPCGRLLCPLGRGVWRRPHMHTVGGTGAACPRLVKRPSHPSGGSRASGGAQCSFPPRRDGQSDGLISE